MRHVPGAHMCAPPGGRMRPPEQHRHFSTHVPRRSAKRDVDLTSRPVSDGIPAGMRTAERESRR